MNKLNIAPEIELAADSVEIYHSNWQGLAPVPAAEELRILSQPEREFLSRLRKPEDRVSYAKAHILLRRSLQKYTGVAAADLEFTTSTTGKPELIRSRGLQHIEFNLTHCETMVACAISLTPVGIDVEPNFRVLEPETIQHILHREEWQLLQGVNASDQATEIMHFWTCKEAALKALGLGLSIEPNQVLIRLADEREAIAHIPVPHNTTAQCIRLYRNLSPLTAHSLTVACMSPSITHVRVFAVD